MIPNNNKLDISTKFWNDANRSKQGLSTLSELTLTSKTKNRPQTAQANLISLKNNQNTTQEQFATTDNYQSEDHNDFNFNSTLGPRDKPFGFFSVLAGTKISLQDVDSKPKKRAEDYNLQARNQAPDVNKRAVSSMNTVNIDNAIDSKLFKFGNKSQSTKEIEYCIKSHNYVKNINQRPQTVLTSEIARKYIQKKQTNVRPYTASA